MSDSGSRLVVQSMERSTEPVYQDGENEQRKKSSRTILIIFGVVALVAALALVIVLPIYFTNLDDSEPTDFMIAMEDIRTDSGYVEVRDNAYIFWMLYYKDDSFTPSSMKALESTPLVIWLQGGPGGASTGYGLFEEVGPLDLNYQRRSTSWTGLAHVLFIDQPVGTGYSYVTNDNAFAQDFNQAGKDLVAAIKGFYEKVPQMKSNPLYIFCQSYGGKFAVAAAQEIAKEIDDGTMDVDFKGVGLGSAYISPIDSLLSWADYLHNWGLVDQLGRAQVNTSAMLAKTAIENGQWMEAYNHKMATQEMVKDLTDNADVYNILYPHYPVEPESDPYDVLMKQHMPEYLGNIPENVVWGSQRSGLENAMREDFMKPVIDKVDSLLNDNFKVVVYNGMLDMIVSTPGQKSWVEKLQWNDKDAFLEKDWQPVLRQDGDTGGFSKSVGNFKFWWIINAGHSIPIDQGEFMLHVLHSTCST